MIKPMGERVVAEPMAVSDVVRRELNAIVLPDSAAQTEAREREFRLGRVLAVGTGGAQDVEPGQVVVWRKFEGVETSVDGRDVVILGVEQVLGVVEGLDE